MHINVHFLVNFENIISTPLTTYGNATMSVAMKIAVPLNGL